MAVYVTIPYVDRKTEKGVMKLRVASSDDFDEAAFTTNIASISQCAFSEYDFIVENEFTTPQAVGAGTDMSNDKDVKAVMLFDWPDIDAHIRVSIPAPKINIEAGLVVRWGQNKAFIPKTKAVGEVGKDGDTVATQLATALGATGLEFLSGSLLKHA
jgi:hypothetical protein